MRAFQNRPRLRWLVPIAAAVTILSGGLLAGTAVAEPALPERTAEQLVAEVAAARPTNFSGTIQTSAELGLPELPGGRRGSDFEALLAGNNTIRIWAGAEDQSRVAVHGTFGESDLIRNGSEVWLWNSQEKTAVHSTLSGKERQRPDDAPTPQQLAAKAIAAIQPSTQVDVARNVTVAGRSAYELVLQPKDDRSLVEQIRIAVDGETYLPLRVQVLAEGGERPAAEAAFTAIDFTAPDPSVFEFTPPPGTEVKKDTDGDHSDDHGKSKQPKDSDKSKGADGPTVIGKGWTAVYLAEQAGAKGSESDSELLNALPRVSGTWGTGRLFSSRLVSAVITDDGRVAAGAVRPELLYDALER
ncbi:LolA family protein [Microlunatus speluncae]|uniref:LolA family protein n=1 Tax=Microlunatus speluncae TaxID=2594267 RepID=UPI0012660701|nr:sigma-E factor regulatory protein RseB domain-containing protein [Microlunatus speluncae]